MSDAEAEQLKRRVFALEEQIDELIDAISMILSGSNLPASDAVEYCLHCAARIRERSRGDHEE